MANDELRNLISKVGGQLDALTTALAAICETLPPDSELAGLINGRLEQSISSKLHDSQNEAYVEGFETARSLLVAQLERVPPAADTSPSGGS